MKTGIKESAHVINGLLNLFCRGDDKVERWHLALWQAAYDLLGLRVRAGLGEYNGVSTLRVSGPDQVRAFNFTVLVTAHYLLDSTHEDMEAMVRRLMEEYRRV